MDPSFRVAFPVPRLRQRPSNRDRRRLTLRRCATIAIVLATVAAGPARSQTAGAEVDAAAMPSYRWVAGGAGTTENLRDVHFASPEFGWIGGDNLTILRSTTGGASWAPMPPHEGWAAPPDCCMSVSTRALPSPEAWLAGPKKALRFGATSNSGAYSYGEVVLHAVFPIPGSDIAWYGGSTLASGGSLRLYRKTSSATLTVIFFNGGVVKGIAFAGEDEGWAVATGGRIIHVRNGKASQPSIDVNSAPTGSNLNAIFLLDAANAWIVGDSGTILRMTNLGPWTMQYAGVVNHLRDIAFRDAARGVIVGDGGLILTTVDSGATWNLEPSGTSVDLLGVSWAGETAVAVGNGGTILMRTKVPPARGRLVRR